MYEILVHTDKRTKLYKSPTSSGYKLFIATFYENGKIQFDTLPMSADEVREVLRTYENWLAERTPQRKAAEKIQEVLIKSNQLGDQWKAMKKEDQEELVKEFTNIIQKTFSPGDSK